MSDVLLTTAEREVLARDVLGGASPSPIMTRAVERIVAVRVQQAEADAKAARAERNGARQIADDWRARAEVLEAELNREHNRAVHAEGAAVELCAARDALDERLARVAALRYDLVFDQGDLGNDTLPIRRMVEMLDAALAPQEARDA